MMKTAIKKNVVVITGIESHGKGFVHFRVILPQKQEGKIKKEA